MTAALYVQGIWRNISKKYLDTVSSVVKGEPHQQLLTTFLGKMIDLYTVMTYHFADAMAEVDRVAEDEGLKQSLRRYAIESGAIMERVYRKRNGTSYREYEAVFRWDFTYLR